jgi:hypothetical protein
MQVSLLGPGEEVHQCGDCTILQSVHVQLKDAGICSSLSLRRMAVRANALCWENSGQYREYEDACAIFHACYRSVLIEALHEIVMAMLIPKPPLPLPHSLLQHISRVLTISAVAGAFSINSP